jgi:lipopolysaccharide assembly outer membrane protein LptD (OstA)
MATPQNRNNTRVGAANPDGNNTSKKNYTAIRYGNDHGSISFGHIHKDAAVTSDILLQGSDGRHGITLDKDGERKGWTTITNPGNLSIKAGLDNVEDQDTIFINSENGNINIIASNGKIRLQGTDIELIAVGEGGSKGNVRIKATENIELDANKVLINAKAMYKIASSGNAEIVANSCMTIYSSVIRGISDAVANRDSKVGGQDYQRKQNK